MAFALPIDIAGRACQIVGARRFTVWGDGSREATEIGFNYDKLRVAELNRNLWTFSTRRVILRAISIDSVLWTPPAWVTATAYAAGAVVAYTPSSGPYSGVLDYWQLTVAEASSTVSPDLDPLWNHYTGPVALDLFDTGGASYMAGEVVLVPAQWVASTNYAQNAIVSYNSGTSDAPSWDWYVSLNQLTSYFAPTVDTDNWVKWTGQGRANGSFGVTATNSPFPLQIPANSTVYLSLYNNNAEQPLNNCGTWMLLGGAFGPLQLVWPVNVGPAHDLATLNAFYQPHGYLREAPTDPRGGQHSYLGASSGSAPEDRVTEGRVIICPDAGPILLRFVADLTNVAEMSPLFCEGLAARIGLEGCEQFTQDPQKQGLARGAYRSAISDARGVNAVEVGSVSMTENRYVTVRA